jgi:tetratricopeptide (TPR) repeat protein
MATDPMNIDLPNQLLQIEQKSGNYREVERVARDILKKASPQTDSITAWNYIIQALNGSGRIAESMKELDGYEDFLSKMVPRSRLVMEDFITRMSYLMRTENYEDVYGYLDELASYDPAMAEIYRCYLPLQLLSEGVREEVALDQVVDCMDQFAKVSPGVLRIAEAYQAVLQGDEGKGADIIDELLADKQVSMQAVSYARINRTAGRYERATELLENELKSQPNQPDLLLELAQVKNAQGDVEAAKTLLPRALKTWEKADENFRAARIARELAVELGMELQ